MALSILTLHACFCFAPWYGLFGRRVQYSTYSLDRSEHSLSFRRPHATPDGIAHGPSSQVSSGRGRVGMSSTGAKIRKRQEHDSNPSSGAAQPSVLCIGETLFDGLPSGIFLGGAPLNCAVHLRECGINVKFASAVGRDRLGREAIRRLAARGVDVALISTVDGEETGFVEVDIDQTGDASYEFATPAAWDKLQLDGIDTAASNAEAVVFGTLGQRGKITAAAVKSAAAAARYTVCDINLRPPFDDTRIVAESARGVNLLKLNDEELLPVAKALGVEAACEAAELCNMPDASAGDIAEAAAAIGRAAGASTVVVTRGADGAVVWDANTSGEAWACTGFRAPSVSDSVGAGDAFLAALLATRLLDEGASWAVALETGCRVGAFVAGQRGATPFHDHAAIEALEPVSEPVVYRLDMRASL